MFREYDQIVIIELFTDQIRYPQFLLDPQGHGHQIRTQSPGCVCEIGLKDTLKFDERLIVKSNDIDIFNGQVGVVQTKLNGGTPPVTLADRSIQSNGGAPA